MEQKEGDSNVPCGEIAFKEWNEDANDNGNQTIRKPDLAPSSHVKVISTTISSITEQPSTVTATTEQPSTATATTGHDTGVWHKSLEDQAGFLSKWMLYFLNPLMHLGAKKVLDASDIGVPSAQDRADLAYQRSSRAWQRQVVIAEAINRKIEDEQRKTWADEGKQKCRLLPLKRPSIAKALVSGFGLSTFIVANLYIVMAALLNFIPILILHNLVKFFESGEALQNYEGLFHPWTQVVALGILPILISLLQARHFALMGHAAVFARTAVSTLLYRTAVHVSASSRARTSTGQVLNMMSNDTAQLQRFLLIAGQTLTAPIQIIVALGFIYQQVSR